MLGQLEPQSDRKVLNDPLHARVVGWTPSRFNLNLLGVPV